MDSEQVRQLVENRLREAQQNKVYKDYGRISGTAKERKALGFITVTITEEQERSLDELADLVKKDKILPKFDAQQERANGNTAGAAYFRYQVLRNWIPKPTVKAREVFTLYVQALTQWNEVTGKNTTLQTAREAFVALFQCNSWERDKNGIIANQAAAIKSLEGKDWSRYTDVNPDYKYKEDMKAAMLAIVGKQIVKAVAWDGGDWYKEAKDFEALSREEGDALLEKYMPRLQENVDVWSQGIAAIANASTLEELAAATKSDLMAKKYGKIEWREEVLKRVRAKTWTLENGRQQLVDFWKRQAGSNLVSLQDAMKKYSPRDEDWSWTAKYFGRTVERKAPADGGITVNSYPNLQHLERRNGLAVASKLSTTQLAENWGLKAVQYGNSLSDGESARLTYWGNASFMDLAELVQLNIQQLNKSMGLGLDLATRGRKGSVATYWPSYTVINLNRYGGDGSLAHEWAHAMDHWLGRRRNSEGYLSESVASITEGARASEKAVRDIMRFTFGHGYQESVTVKASERIRYRLPAIDTDKSPAEFHAWLMQQWSRDTMGNRRTQEEIAADVAKAYGVESITVQVNSQGSDQYQGSKAMNKLYWIKPVELFARSFEGYVMYRMGELDLQSDYLQEPRKWAQKYGVYPSDRDMETLAPLFKAFFAVLAAEEGMQLRMDELPIVRPAGQTFTNMPRESHKEAVPAPKGKADETGEELVEEQESEAQGEAPTPEARPQVAEVVVQSFVPLDDEPGWGADFYDDVRDEVERMGEMTTSDAQGVISAWVLRQRREGKQDYQDQGSASTTARAILGIPTQELAPEPEAQRQVQQVADPPDTAPTPAAKKAAPQGGKWKAQLQRVANTMNASIEKRLKESPENGIESTYRFTLGTMAREQTYFNKVHRNVEAEHVLNFGPYAIHLHRDYHQSGTREHPDPNPYEFKRYTLSTFGITWGIENLTGDHHTNTRTSTMDAMEFKTGDMMSRMKATALVEVIEKARNTTQPGEAVAPWSCGVLNEKALKGRHGNTSVSLERGDDTVHLQFDAARGHITVIVRKFTATAYTKVQLPDDHPFRNFSTERIKYVQEFLADLCTGIVAVDAQGVPELTPAFAKKWGAMPLIEPWSISYKTRPKYSAAQLGFAPTSGRWLHVEPGVPVETDAHVMLLDGSKITPKIKRRDPLRTTPLKLLNVQTVISQAQGSTSPMRVVGVNKGNHFTEREPYVVLVNEGNTKAVFLRQSFVDLFASIYGDSITFSVKDTEKWAYPVGVHSGGNLVGIIMPVTLDRVEAQEAAIDVAKGASIGIYQDPNAVPPKIIDGNYIDMRGREEKPAPAPVPEPAPAPVPEPDPEPEPAPAPVPESEAEPEHQYALGDGWRQNFDNEGMLAYFEKAKAGQLDRDQLGELHESLEDTNHHTEAAVVWAMMEDIDDPKPTPEQLQDAQHEDLLTYLFTGDKTSAMQMPKGDHLPVVGQLVVLGMDAVDVGAQRIVLARPGASVGVAVFNEQVGKYEYRHLFKTARWDEGVFVNSWEVEERTQWPSLREAVAAVYATGGTLDIFAQELEEVAALPAEEIKARKRPEGKPPSPQQWRKVKAKLKGMARQADGEDMESLRETAQRIQALRGYYGQVDEASRNKRTRPLTKKTLVSWAKAPGRMDLEGIDTPR